MAMTSVVCEPRDYCRRWTRGTYSEPVRMQLACPVKCPKDKPISKEIVSVFVSLLPSYREALESSSTTFHLSGLSPPLRFASFLTFSGKFCLRLNYTSSVHIFILHHKELRSPCHSLTLVSPDYLAPESLCQGNLGQERTLTLQNLNQREHLAPSQSQHESREHTILVSVFPQDPKCSLATV